MASGRVPRSVISAKVKLADRCKSMLSEYTSVLKARRGSPEKKSVSARCRRSECGGACSGWWWRYVFEEAQQVGDGFALAVGQHGVIDAVLGASCAIEPLVVLCDSGRARCIPPQQVPQSLEKKWETPIVAVQGPRGPARGVRGARWDEFVR